ncbi:hypothetical protein BgiMline_036363, partial [Biomphalaria glabrata]
AVQVSLIVSLVITLALPSVNFACSRECCIEEHSTRRALIDFILTLADVRGYCATLQWQLEHLSQPRGSNR